MRTTSLIPTTFFAGHDYFWDQLAGLFPEVGVSFVDTYETETSVEVAANIAGFDKSEVTVELHEDSLVLSGRKKEQKTNDRFASFGRKSFDRSVSLSGLVIDRDNVNASYENGILRVTLPKAITRPTSRKIEIR